MGTSTLHFETAEGSGPRYNTAALYSPDGRLADSYHKMHPVMFGEYAPFGEIFPWDLQLHAYFGRTVCRRDAEVIRGRWNLLRAEHLFRKHGAAFDSASTC